MTGVFRRPAPGSVPSQRPPATTQAPAPGSRPQPTSRPAAPAERPAGQHSSEPPAAQRPPAQASQGQVPQDRSPHQLPRPEPVAQRPAPRQSSAAAETDWSKEDPSLTAKRAKEGNELAQREAHRRASLLAEHIRSAPVQESILRTLRASSLVAESQLEKRLQEFTADAIGQISDRRLPTYYQAAFCSPASVEGALVKFAASNISPNHGAEAGYLIPRWAREEGVFLAVATPGIKGQINVIKSILPPDKTGFFISTEVVRQQDDFRVLKGTTPSIHHEVCYRVDTEKPNEITAAYCVIGINNVPPVAVVYSRAMIETITGVQLGTNTFYKKAPEKEATNVPLREALRQFIRTRTVAPELATLDNMLTDTNRIGEDPSVVEAQIDTPRHVAEAPIETTAARPGATHTLDRPPRAMPTPGRTPNAVDAAVRRISGSAELMDDSEGLEPDDESYSHLAPQR